MDLLPQTLVDGHVFLLDKPLRWTSFQAVNKIKYLTRHRLGLKKLKIGHAGTLDPLASGLLIICTGKKTKQIETYQAQEKEYEGVFTLGATTPCFDLEQDIDAYYPTDHLSEEMILNATQAFTGTIEQVPPIFSAIRVAGRRAFDYARKDQDVTLKGREITISTFEITEINLPHVSFRVVCSKGTYIRSLARDFGLHLGSGAHLSALRRTRIGDYLISDALSIEQLEQLFPEKLKEEEA